MERRHEGRINLRVDPEQEARLRAAAKASGETLTGFLLAAGTERAAAILERERRIVLDAAAFERFVAALDDDAETMPALSRYAAEPGPIPGR